MLLEEWIMELLEICFDILLFAFVLLIFALYWQIYLSVLANFRFYTKRSVSWLKLIILAQWITARQVLHFLLYHSAAFLSELHGLWSLVLQPSKKPSLFLFTFCFPLNFFKYDHLSVDKSSYSVSIIGNFLFTNPVFLDEFLD